ncbi:17394_t:CDS:1, partial [Funneliformis caledonium]
MKSRQKSIEGGVNPYKNIVKCEPVSSYTRFDYFHIHIKEGSLPILNNQKLNSVLES